MIKFIEGLTARIDRLTARIEDSRYDGWFGFFERHLLHNICFFVSVYSAFSGEYDKAAYQMAAAAYFYVSVKR